jgi:hypothetical protein
MSMTPQDVEYENRADETTAVVEALQVVVGQLSPCEIYTDDVDRIETLVRLLRRCHRAERIAFDATKATKELIAAERASAVDSAIADFRRRQAAAHAAVAAAIDDGALVRPEKCSVCGEPHRRIVAHHDSYDENRRLDVRWLCPSCHGKHHAEHGSAA